MALTFLQLISPITVDDAETTCLAILKLAGFPATSWQAASIPRRLVRLGAELFCETRSGIAELAMGRVLDFATGDALTVLARTIFLVERAASRFTTGQIILTEDGGGPYNGIQPGQIKVVSDNGLIFVNTTGGDLGIGGTLTLTVIAENPGAAHNVPIGAISAFFGAGALTGVDVSNDEIAGTGTWITSAGANQQSDASVKLACRAKWSTLGAGTANAYISWSLEGAPTLTRAKVIDDQPNGPGTVKVVLANAAGGASSDEVTDAAAVVQHRRPLGLGGVEIVGATNHTVVVAGVVYVRSSLADGASAAIATAFTEYTGEAVIGEDVYRTKVHDLCHFDRSAVRNVALTSPASDTVLTEVETPTFDLSGLSVEAI